MLIAAIDLTTAALFLSAAVFLAKNGFWTLAVLWPPAAGAWVAWLFGV